MDFKDFIQSDQANIPINNGNLLQLHTKLRAIEGQNIDMWMLYISERKYFSNLFSFEGDDTLRYMGSVFMKHLVENGKIAIKKGRKGDPQIFALVDVKRDFTGRIVKGEGIPLTFRMINENKAKAIPLTENNAIFVQWDSDAYPLMFKLYRFIFKMNRYLTSADTNMITKTKKFKYNMNNNSSIIQRREMESFLDPSTPFVVNITSPTTWAEKTDTESKGTTNNVVEKMDSNSNSAEAIFDDIKEFEKIWYKRLGRRMNLSAKKQRLISDEIDNENVNFDIFESDTFIQLERFVKEYNKMFGVNAKLVSNVKMEEKEEAEIKKGDEK